MNFFHSSTKNIGTMQRVSVPWKDKNKSYGLRSSSTGKIGATYCTCVTYFFPIIWGRICEVLNHYCPARSSLGCFNTRWVEQAGLCSMCSMKANTPGKHGRGQSTPPYLRPLGEQWSVLLLEQVEQLVLLVLRHHLAHCLVILLLLLQRLMCHTTPNIQCAVVSAQATSFSHCDSLLG